METDAALTIQFANFLEHAATVPLVLTRSSASTVEHKHEHHVTAPYRPMGWVLMFRSSL